MQPNKQPFNNSIGTVEVKQRDKTDIRKEIRDYIEANPFLGQLSKAMNQLDMHGRRITNAGASVDASDYVTRRELDELRSKLNDLIKKVDNMNRK